MFVETESEKKGAGQEDRPSLEWTATDTITAVRRRLTIIKQYIFLWEGRGPANCPQKWQWVDKGVLQQLQKLVDRNPVSQIGKERVNVDLYVQQKC